MSYELTWKVAEWVTASDAEYKNFVQKKREELFQMWKDEIYKQVPEAKDSKLMYILWVDCFGRLTVDFTGLNNDFLSEEELVDMNEIISKIDKAETNLRESFKRLPEEWFQYEVCITL